MVFRRISGLIVLTTSEIYCILEPDYVRAQGTGVTRRMGAHFDGRSKSNVDIRPWRRFGFHGCHLGEEPEASA